MRSHPIKSLNKVLDLLELIGEASGIGIHELSAKTGFPPPTVHRILKTLVERGYLRRNQGNKHYLLSTQFLYFSDRTQQQFDLIPITRPHLEMLSAKTEASANLCIRDNLMVVYIDHVYNHKQILRTFTRLGARAPLYATGVGKIFMTQMTTEELDDYFTRTKMEPYTDHTITDKKTMLAEIGRVREQGYAIDEQERAIGVRCIAAPVHDHNGSIVAAISISGATQFIPSKQIKPLSRFVISSAAQISDELGYRHNGGKHNAKQG